jgi:hypothetical protein
MSREDIHKLLGGYATGTLTPEEQQILFEAALEDQELFDALAREQALREVLDDPAARAQLLAAVDDVPVPWYRRWWRPVPMAALATALAVVTIVAVRESSRPPRPVRAKLELPAVPRAAPSAPILPPPPESASAARPVLTPFSLPAPMGPALAPPPPPASKAVLAKEAKQVVVPSGAAPAVVPPSRPNAVNFQINGALSNPQAAPAPGSVAGNAFVGPSNIPVHGTVTDATGAPVRSVSVEVKTVATGAVFRTSTNERGEFIAPEQPGTAYQISASAPGFQTRTVSSVTPPFGTPEPLNLRLEVGAATESVMVTAAAEAITPAAATGGGGGRGGRGGAGGAMASAATMKRQEPAAQQVEQGARQSQSQQAGNSGVPSVAGALSAPPPPAPLSLQYRILRRMPGGDLVEVAADGTVAKGATVILRITPNADGYLRISQSNGRQIFNHAVRGMQPLETPLPKFNRAARVELQVLFSRRPFQSKEPAQFSAGAVTGRDASAQQILVTITLNIQ